MAFMNNIPLVNTSMLCTAWIGECPNLKTVSQSMTHDGMFLQICVPDPLLIKIIIE